MVYTRVRVRMYMYACIEKFLQSENKLENLSCILLCRGLKLHRKDYSTIRLNIFSLHKFNLVSSKIIS